MALSVNSISPTFLDSAFGQVIELTATIDSTTSLVGSTIRVFPGLFEANPVVLPYALNSSYWSLLYPGAGTNPMTWVGPAKYQNLTLNLEYISNTQFRLHLDAIIAADRFDINQQIDPTNFLLESDFYFSIYNISRYLNLHVFEGSNKTVVSVPTMAVPPKIQLIDNFQYVFRRSSSGETVGQPTAGEDLIIEFSLDDQGIDFNNVYSILIANSAFCSTNNINQSLIQNLNIEGAISPTPTASPSLSATNINAMVNLANTTGSRWAGSFTIDGNRITEGCEQTVFIILTDISNNNYSYKLSFTPIIQNVPDPTVVVKGQAEGDNTIYTTNIFTNVPPCAKITVYSEMDTASYNSEIATLGLTGNYNSNLITINVYALDHEPVTNEDLSEYIVLDSVGGPPLLPGNAFFTYQIPEDAEGVTFIIFDYVFKDHSIRVPVTLLHPVLTPLNVIEFFDLDDVQITGNCYDYQNGLRIKLTTPDINAFDWDDVQIYKSGELFPAENLFSLFTLLNLTDDEVYLEVNDLADINLDDSFCVAVINSPIVSEALGGCAGQTISATQTNVSAGQFSISLEHTLGAGFLFPRNYLIVKRNGTVIHKEYFDDDWTGPANVFLFNSETLNQNIFTYELFIHTEDGCKYYQMFNLSTNHIVADFDNDVFVITP